MTSGKVFLNFATTATRSVSSLLKNQRQKPNEPYTGATEGPDPSER